MQIHNIAQNGFDLDKLVAVAGDKIEALEWHFRHSLILSSNVRRHGQAKDF